MPVGVIVTARMDSRRLPGKALLSVNGRPLLVRVLDRVRAVPGRPKIVLATSDRELDDPIAALAEDQCVAVFRGSAEDVAGRVLAAAEAHGFTRFVRVSGDSPFVDPEMIAEFLVCQRALDADVVTNVMPRTLPPGASIEVVKTAAMRRLVESTRDADDREHVTRFFYRQPQHFHIENIAGRDRHYAALHLAVDTEEDLHRASWILRALGRRAATAPLAEVADLARRWPGMTKEESARGAA